MNKVKKQNRLRLFIQCLSFAFHNGYAKGWLTGRIYTGANKAYCVPGLNCYSCPGALGACPIGSLQAVMDSGKYSYKISLYVFGFIGAVGVLCGRFVCGWLCPFGLIQDLLHKIPFSKKMKNLPGHTYLKYLRYVFLIVFVILLPITILDATGMGQPWFCEWICPSGTLLGGIPLVIANANMRTAIGFRFYWKVAILILCIVLSILSYRPFCKYVCPLGALYGLANPISLYRFKVNTDTCTQCGGCQNVCGMDIPTWKKPNSTECIRCGKCLAACPTNSISTTLSQVLPKKEEPNVENVKTSMKVKAVIAGLLCFVNSLGMMPMYYIAFQQALTYNLQETLVDSFPSFIAHYGSYLFALIPTIMIFIFGIKCFIVLWHPEDYEDLSSWPKKNLLTIGITTLLSFIVQALANHLINQYGLIVGGYQAALNMISQALVLILPILSCIIALVLVRKPKKE